MNQRLEDVLTVLVRLRDKRPQDLKGIREARAPIIRAIARERGKTPEDILDGYTSGLGSAIEAAFPTDSLRSQSLPQLCDQLVLRWLSGESRPLRQALDAICDDQEDRQKVERLFANAAPASPPRRRT